VTYISLIFVNTMAEKIAPASLVRVDGGHV